MTESDKKSGIVFLVGSGPGDPGLMTLRGRECIERADVVVYDFLSNPEMLEWARADAEKVFAGKRAREHTLTQDEINALLVEKARAGLIVTRLKGGDPFIFGRGGEEAEALAEAGVPFEFVPGISSAMAAPAYAGIPLTHREHCSQVTIFTGHEDPGKEGSMLDYGQLAHAPGTRVMLMGADRIRTITEAMMEKGADPALPAAMIQWATTGRQKTVSGTLGTIADEAERVGIAAPAVAVFGEVAAMRDSLNWFESRPLLGRRVVVTRTAAQAGRLSQGLREKGADVLEMPTIRIEPPAEEDLREFAHLVTDAHTYDWLIFTSPNGVERFFEAFYTIRSDAREIGGPRIAAVGPGTKAKLAEYRVTTDLMPENHVAEGLVDAFVNEIGSIENNTMLWVRPKEARDVLSRRLNEAGVILDEAIAYRTVPETDDPTGAVKRFREEGAEIITFTSGSTVDGFFDLGLDIPDETRIVSIGPVTSAVVEENGYDVDLEAGERTIEGLIEAVVLLSSQITEEETW